MSTLSTDNIELVERFQNMVSTQLDLIERYSRKGSSVAGLNNKLDVQLGNLIAGLGRFTRHFEQSPVVDEKKSAKKS
jgi:hypothetical protein